MLRTRLWMGAVLIALAVGVLVIDQMWAPYYPFLFVLILMLSELACVELVHLLPTARRPPISLCVTGVAALVVANWISHVPATAAWVSHNAWFGIAVTLAAYVLAVFIVEMATFDHPGDAVPRMAAAILVVSYLGVLPSFFVQLRWQNLRPDAIGSAAVPGSTVALALAIFVPKCCDIGAYFTGRLLGRHPMAPVLSPKKTWEGAAGGLVAAALAAVGINRIAPVLPNVAAEVGFGLTMGFSGMVGDLAESLIKRDLQTKDASQTVPGFGGVLDVVDAILFAAPVAYLWLAVQP